MSYSCPKCASSEVRKLSLVYNEGLSTINSQSFSAGSMAGSGGGMGWGTASTATVGRQQSALSKQAAPPPRKAWLFWGFVAGLFGLMGVSSLAHPGISTLVCLGIAAWSVRQFLSARAYNATVHPDLLQRWERSFLCNRCGEMFVPA